VYPLDAMCDLLADPARRLSELDLVARPLLLERIAKRRPNTPIGEVVLTGIETYESYLPAQSYALTYEIDDGDGAIWRVNFVGLRPESVACDD
jgi:hypothetical protein